MIHIKLFAVLTILLFGQNFIVFGQNLNDPPEDKQINLLKTEIWILPTGDIEYIETIEAIGKIDDIKQQKYEVLPIYYDLLENSHVGFKKKYSTKAIYFHKNFHKNLRKNCVSNYRYYDALLYDVKDGHNWKYPIDSIHFIVHLPKGGKLLWQEKISPSHPELTRDVISTKIDDETITFSSKQKIKPDDPFLIGVFFKKALVENSYQEQKEEDDSEDYERIKLFKSEIWIEPSGKIRVTENISVRVKGDLIKRGIVRSFPTKYKNKSGGVAKVSFKVNAVTKNNMPEPYHMKGISNGEAIYVGEENVILSHGDYDYKIKYETDGQLGFFDEHDELYWNVNGNDWEMRFDSIACVVHLPQGAPIKSYTAYSGRQGEKGKDFVTKVIDKHTIVFSSTKRYFEGEGLTIVVGWPKGFVEEPSFLSQLWREYNVYVFVVLGLLFIGGFYYFTWKKVGVDPPKDVIYPLFYPPNDLSPSALGYISTYGKASNLLTSEIINLASKKALTIKELSKEYEIFMLIKNEPKDLTKFEQKLFDTLFEEGDELLLDKKNWEIFQAAEKVVEKQCESQNRNNKLFNTNFVFSCLGNVMTLFIFILGWVICFWNFGFVMVVIPLLILSVAVAIVPKTDSAWKFIFPFFVIVFFVLNGVINSESSFLYLLFWLVLAGINWLFFFLLKAPTVAGQKLMGQIEGFKMYLSIAEEERLRHLHPPDVTQEVFEKYLSYAMALGVENEWGKKFDHYIKSANIEVDSSSITWYSDSHLIRFNGSSFSSSLSSSLSSATSASSSTPGSSSGFSSGGSSGGGGGGGGGGGW